MKHCNCISTDIVYLCRDDHVLVSLLSISIAREVFYTMFFVSTEALRQLLGHISKTLNQAGSNDYFRQLLSIVVILISLLVSFFMFQLPDRSLLREDFVICDTLQLNNLGNKCNIISIPFFFQWRCHVN